MNFLTSRTLRQCGASDPECFPASDEEGDLPDPTEPDVGFIRENGIGAWGSARVLAQLWSSFSMQDFNQALSCSQCSPGRHLGPWAFQTHMDMAVMQEFVSAVQTARGIPDFHDGLPIASICIGWGTCEMVIDSINSFVSDHFPSCPQATVICFLCFLCFVSSFPSMGSSMFAMIMFDFVFNLYSAQFTISFMCEKEPWKANYLQKARPGVKVLFQRHEGSGPQNGLWCDQWSKGTNSPSHWISTSSHVDAIGFNFASFLNC